MNKTTRTMLIISVIIIVLMTVLSLYANSQLPAGEPVCIHWNAAGECDGTGGKFIGLFLMPLVVAAVTLLFVFLPRLEPRASNLAKSATALTIVWGSILVFFAAFHVVITLELLGSKGRMDLVAPLATGLMFVAIGAAMRSMKSTYTMGIRTPWTLASDVSWTKTHQLGSIMFMALGVLIVIATLALPPVTWTYFLLGGIFGSIVVLFVYSYIVWKNDPDSTAAKSQGK